MVNAEDLGPILARGTADDPDRVPRQEPFGFQLSEGEALTLEAAVFQALGAASTCWDTLENAGVFDSTRAKEIGDTLVQTIRTLFTGEVNPEEGYTVELGGQVFTHEQWEAVQTYMAGTRAGTE